jgi:hypothetical protein
MYDRYWTHTKADVLCDGIVQGEVGASISTGRCIGAPTCLIRQRCRTNIHERRPITPIVSGTRHDIQIECSRAFVPITLCLTAIGHFESSLKLGTPFNVGPSLNIPNTLTNKRDFNERNAHND